MDASHHLLLFVSTIPRVDAVKSGCHSRSCLAFDEKAKTKTPNEAAAAAKHKCGLVWRLMFECQTGNKREHIKEVPDLSGSKGKAVAKMADQDGARRETGKT